MTFEPRLAKVSMNIGKTIKWNTFLTNTYISEQITNKVLLFYKQTVYRRITENILSIRNEISFVVISTTKCSM